VIRLSLPTTLVAYLPAEEGSDRRSRAALSLAASTWPEAVSEIRERFPLLAGRVLEAAGETTAEGFVLVVNGDVAPEGRPASLQAGDEILFIPQIAGG
jgi:molybdopterin converting factor small subunit